MDSIFPRFVVALVGLGAGFASAQTDSSLLKKDSVAASAVALPTIIDTAKPLLQAVPAAVSDTIRKDSARVSNPAVDTAKNNSASVALDSSRAKLDSGKVVVVKTDSVAPRACKPLVWALEGGVRYGWRLGALLDEEDRLTRQFKVVLLGANDDTTAVNPIASGVAYQATVWLKAHCGNQLGLGLQYGQFSEHPASSYSSDLTESFLESYLVTARYRYVKPVGNVVDLFGEAAAGWNHSTLHRVPLVSAHIGDSKLKFSNADKDLIAAVHRESSSNGIHGEAGIGGALKFAQAWSVALSANGTWDKVWLQASSDEIEAQYATSPSYWGFDIGLSVAREF